MTGIPRVVDQATWQSEIDALRIREKAHTREGDAIAAVRRRLPMVEIDATTPVIGPRGQVTLLDAFEGRSQLIGRCRGTRRKNPSTPCSSDARRA